MIIFLIFGLISFIVLMTLGTGFFVAAMVCLMRDSVDEKWAIGFFIACVTSFFLMILNGIVMSVMETLLW